MLFSSLRRTADAKDKCSLSSQANSLTQSSSFRLNVLVNVVNVGLSIHRCIERRTQMIKGGLNFAADALKGLPIYDIPIGNLQYTQ